MASFVIGKDANWIELPVRPPIEATPHPIQTISESLGGVSTVNRVAVKYRWTLNLAISSAIGQVQVLFEQSAGPYYFWDGSYAAAPEPYTGTDWLIVIIEGFTPTHYSRNVRSGVLTLREV